MINCSWGSGTLRIWRFGDKAALFQPQMAKTYIKDTAAEALQGEGDGGNGDEEANEGGDDSDYFHPVGHNSAGWVMLRGSRLPVLFCRR